MSRQVTGNGDDDSVVNGDGASEGDGVGSGDSVIDGDGSGDSVIDGDGDGNGDGVTWDSDRLIRLYTSVWVIRWRMPCALCNVTATVILWHLAASWRYHGFGGFKALAMLWQLQCYGISNFMALATRLKLETQLSKWASRQKISRIEKNSR